MQRDEVWVQLATRIPKQLHRALKLHCVKNDVSVMAFVVVAIEDRLKRDASTKGEGRRLKTGS